jgi:succinate dehydrogenase/fumarate reductase flavoprotein subunit
VKDFGSQIEAKTQVLENIKSRSQGPDWYEANMALQHTMADYAGTVRSKSMLKAGLRHLSRLKDKVHNTIHAKNHWELTRCLEVINLYDLGELVFIASLERCETRGSHQRVDYPYTDPLLNDKMLVIKKMGDKPFKEWRDMPS